MGRRRKNSDTDSFLAVSLRASVIRTWRWYYSTLYKRSNWCRRCPMTSQGHTAQVWAWLQSWARNPCTILCLQWHPKKTQNHTLLWRKFPHSLDLLKVPVTFIPNLGINIGKTLHIIHCFVIFFLSTYKF